MPIHSKCKLLKKEKLAQDIYKFEIEAEEIAKTAEPRAIFKYKGK